MGGNFGRCRGGTIPGPCFSRAGCMALGSVTGKRIAACRHLLRSCSTAAGVTWQTRSGRFAVIVPQDAAESLAALDLTGDAADFLARIDQSVVDALVIALSVIMGEERNHGGLQRLLSEEDQAMQALILKGAHETLDVGRQVGRPGWQAHSLNPNLLQRGAELLAELIVAIHYKELLAAQESVFRVAEIPGYLDHPRRVGIGGATGEAHSSCRDFHDEQQVVSD